MTKRSTKKTLLASVVSLFICFTMLLGTTFAWFTDSVTSGSNVIKSGNLDIAVQYTLDGETWNDLDGADDLFAKGLWEPGHTEVVALKVTNKGSLALKYTAHMNTVKEVVGKTKGGDDIVLSDILTVSTLIQQSGMIGDIAVMLAFAGENRVAYENTAKFKDVNVIGAEKTLAPNEEQYVIVKVDMAETVGNEANHDGVNLPSIEFGINVLATQYTAETDSYDNQYDKDATYPVIPTVINVATAADLASAKPGAIINIVDDITLDTEVTLPADVTLVGNGKQINGTIYAGGNLTIEGHVKVTSFSASYYDRTINILEGACLEVTGTGRVSLAYGNVFNIVGTIDDAKTTDKATVTPSLIIPGGISITGGSDAVMNVTNAYVSIGSTSSKNSSANGTFTMNFTNSIMEFTNQFTLAEPTSGKTPTFNITIKDSVFTTGTKLCVAAPNSNIVIDNSIVELGTYFRNSGNMTIKNGSVLTGSTIQFGENGGNDGIVTVDNSSFAITATSTGHALDGKGVGKLVLQNGATASVTYYKAMEVNCDATSTFTGTEA